MNLQKLKEWVFGGYRGARISIDSHKDTEKEFKVWVYDYGLKVGQFINDVSEINLEKIKEEEERKQYAILKNKFDGT